MKPIALTEYPGAGARPAWGIIVFAWVFVYFMVVIFLHSNKILFFVKLTVTI